MKMSLTALLASAGAIIATLFVVSCETPTRTPTPPAHYGLEISLLSNVSREAPIGQNLYVSGHFYNPSGEAQRGAMVHFEVEPAGLATITPYAITEPDSARGFSSLVTFTGRAEGLAVIYAYVNDGNGLELANDTLHVQVVRWNG